MQTTVTISNEEITDIMKITKYLEESGLLASAKQLEMKKKNKMVDSSVWY